MKSMKEEILFGSYVAGMVVFIALSGNTAINGVSEFFDSKKHIDKAEYQALLLCEDDISISSYDMNKTKGYIPFSCNNQTFIYDMKLEKVLPLQEYKQNQQKGK